MDSGCPVHVGKASKGEERVTLARKGEARALDMRKLVSLGAASPTSAIALYDESKRGLFHTRGDASARLAAVEAVRSMLPSKLDVSFASRALQDEDESVRLATIGLWDAALAHHAIDFETAATALASREDCATLSVLAKHCNESSAHIVEEVACRVAASDNHCDDARCAALAIIERCEARVPVNVLLSALASDSSLVRRAALHAATAVPGILSKEAIQDVFENDCDWGVRDAAEYLLLITKCSTSPT